MKLTNEQQSFIDKALQGANILVDACIGSGKTTVIQQLCCQIPNTKKVLYLTYNKLLKVDAKEKIKYGHVTVTNYHGFAWDALLKNGVFNIAQSELIPTYNDVKPIIPKYDVLVLDEYQDIEHDSADMLEHIKSVNPNMQIIAVGDMDQKIYDKTTLKVQPFIHNFLGNYETMRFTKCFRLSAEHAAMLGRVWNKKIDGVNTSCRVSTIQYVHALRLMVDLAPGQILCLGNRRGKMADALNFLETNYPQKFNKQTVYASIKDRDANVNPNKNCAIFTTFDSCKGLEKDVCIVFDFDYQNWLFRLKQPLQSYEILRNIFCVAASRGKSKILFVRSDNDMLTETMMKEDLGLCNVVDDVAISEMFDFKYQEDIEDCYKMLKLTKLDIQDDNIIDVKNTDCLIDISPCIGIYQEAFFFKDYNIDYAIKFQRTINRETAEMPLYLSLEEKILYLTYLQTKQRRYREQVNIPFVKDAESKSIRKRLEEEFDGNEPSQTNCQIVFSNNGKLPLFKAVGLIDVIKNNIIYELKFVEALQHAHFLQCACYMVATGIKQGVLWNVKNNEKYKIEVPNSNAFLQQVLYTITKHRFGTEQSVDVVEKRKTIDIGKKTKVGAPKITPTVSSKQMSLFNNKVEPTSNFHDIALENHKNNCTFIDENFAVIDVETNFEDKVVSIGVIISDGYFNIIDGEYYLVKEEMNKPCMYSGALHIPHDYDTSITKYEKAVLSINSLLTSKNISRVFAYNAHFDKKHLPEMSSYKWYDIVKVAAYAQHNPYLPTNIDVHSSGRMKKGYKCEDMYRILSKKYKKELHNAVIDAEDELNIMKMLGYNIDYYDKANAEV